MVSIRVQVRLKGYPPQTATFSRKTDAREWAQQTESSIREGRHFKTAESKKHTLAALIDRYIRTSEVMGHKTLQMAKRYAHLCHSQAAGVVTKMNARIFEEVQ